MGRSRKPKMAFNINITGIAHKGMSVGRDSEGQVYFLQGGVPGDLVDAIIKRKKKGVPFGQVTNIQKFSEHRIEPICDHFGICGGCKWQHLSYDIQLREKEGQVRDAISRIAKVEAEEFIPIKGNERLDNYRNKLEFSFSNKRWLTEKEISTPDKIEQSKALGFHRPGVFDKIVNIEKCHLQNEISNRIRNHIRDITKSEEFDYYDIKGNNGFLREMVVRTNRNGEVMLIMIYGLEDADRIKKINDLVINEFPEIISFYYIINTKSNSSFYDLEPIHIHGERFLTETMRDINYKIGPKSFFQTNTEQSETLYAIARNFAEIKKTDIVYDLYTGLGSIALFVADQCKKVVGIEEIDEAIILAKENAKDNNIENAIFYAGDVKDILTDQFISDHGKADIIITDPPRAGMHGSVVEMLLKTGAEKLVYISCNPATQARDIGLLSENYKLCKIQAVDMFPHTHHVESVALLKLK